MVDDRQTHSLPDDEAGVAAIATFLGYPDSQSFQTDLLDRLHCVEGHYAHLFEEAPSLAGPGGNLVFTGTDDDPGTLETLRTLGFRDPSAAAGIVRRWHHGRYRSTATARARELLTELMPGLLKALGSTAAPDQALLNFDLFLGNLPAGVQLFSLFKSNPALLELVAAIMGSAPGLAAHLARRTVLLDSVLSPAFYRPLPPVAEMTADLAAAAGAASSTSRTSSTWRGAGPTTGASRSACSSSRRIVRPAQAGLAYSDIAAATISALCDRVEQRFAEAHGGFRGQRLAVLGHGQARQPRDVGHLRPRPDLRLRHPARPRGVGRPPAAGADPVLHAAQRQDRDGAHRPHQRRRALRGRHAAAPLRPRRAARQFAGGLRELPCAIGLDVGAHGADARARDPRAGRRWSSGCADIVKSTLCRPRDADWRWCATSPTCATASPAMRRPRARGTSSTCPAACSTSTSWPSTSRCATPPSGPTCSIRIPPRCCAAPPTPASSTAADAERLRAARTLLSDVQSLLRLTLNGDEAAFDEARAPEGQRRLIAATEDADDLAELRARIAAETAAARAIYRRIVEQPARAAGWQPRTDDRRSEA